MSTHPDAARTAPPLAFAPPSPQLAAAAAEGALALQQRALDFTTHRMRRDAEFCGELARCRDLPAALSAWQAFWTDMANDYAAETKAMLRTLDDCVAASRAGAARAQTGPARGGHAHG